MTRRQAARRIPSLAALPLFLAAACNHAPSISDAGDASTCAPGPLVGDLPEDVSGVLQAKCQTCHSDPPQNHAPFPLQTYEETQAPYGTEGLRRWQRMQQVVNPGTLPHMPLVTAPQLTDAELATLNGWFAACAPPIPEGSGTDVGESGSDAGLTDGGLADAGPDAGSGADAGADAGATWDAGGGDDGGADAGGGPGDAGSDGGSAVDAGSCSAPQVACDGGCLAAGSCCSDVDCLNGYVCTASNACAPPSCGSTVNGCTAFTDLTTSPSPTVSFGGTLGLAYSPKCAQIRVGQAVTFQGSFAFHPLLETCGPDPGITETTAGSSATFTFSSAGTYGYECEVHGGLGMVGAINVVP